MLAPSIPGPDSDGGQNNLPQLDLRAQPNAGQTVPAADERGADPSGAAETRERPNASGYAVAPQPEITGLGYSLNSLTSPPNRMTPDVSDLPHGQTPDVDPASIAQWDLWDSVQPVPPGGSGA